ncbi:hypothetical protein MBLNU459_g4813t1 [Dothideomycetes sp. NU459]
MDDTHTATPPPAPNPSLDSSLRPHDVVDASQPKTDDALVLRDERWDIFSVSALSAMKMLAQTVQALANITGDIPPTPPVSRPATPRAPTSHPDGTVTPPTEAHVHSSISPGSPSLASSHCLPTIPIGSPEAQRDEPIPSVEVGANAEALALQHAAIARRFFLKSAPPFTITEYLARIHRYCPHSPGVYLAAASYIHRLCVSDTLVPATSRTIHRLSLAAIRIASKTFEDNKWAQERIAKVGGVSQRELQSMEVNLCFLLDFELFVRAEELGRRMYELQQTALQGIALRKRLSDGFRMKMPHRHRPEAIPV